MAGSSGTYGKVSVDPLMNAFAVAVARNVYSHCHAVKTQAARNEKLLLLISRG
jgi:hypothetical protein